MARKNTQLNRSWSSCERQNCFAINSNRSQRHVEDLELLSSPLPLAKRIQRNAHRRYPMNEGTGKRKHALEETGNRANVVYLNSSGCELEKLLSPAMGRIRASAAGRYSNRPPDALLVRSYVRNLEEKKMHGIFNRGNFSETMRFAAS